MDSGTRFPGFESWLCHLLSHVTLTFPCLCFLIWKMEKLIEHLFHSLFKIKGLLCIKDLQQRWQVVGTIYVLAIIIITIQKWWRWKYLFQLPVWAFAILESCHGEEPCSQFHYYFLLFFYSTPVTTMLLLVPPGLKTVVVEGAGKGESRSYFIGMVGRGRDDRCP